MNRRLLALLAAVVAVLAACNNPASPALIDPKEILTKAVETAAAAKSFHLQADVEGTFNADLTGSGSATPIDLKGTSVTGDVDVANKKAKIALSVPALLGLSADVVSIGQDTWTRVSLLGNRWQHSTTPATASGAASDPQKAIADIKDALDKLPTAPTKLLDEKCGSADCYRVQFKANAADLGPLASAAPGISGDATVDVFVEHGTNRPVKIVLSTSAGDSGAITVTLNLSNWDQPVTIEPPPASEVDEASPSP